MFAATTTPRKIVPELNRKQAKPLNFTKDQRLMGAAGVEQLAVLATNIRHHLLGLAA